MENVSKDERRGEPGKPAHRASVGVFLRISPSEASVWRDLASTASVAQAARTMARLGARTAKALGAPDGAGYHSDIILISNDIIRGAMNEKEKKKQRDIPPTPPIEKIKKREKVPTLPPTPPPGGLPAGAGGSKHAVASFPGDSVSPQSAAPHAVAAQPSPEAIAAWFRENRPDVPEDACRAVSERLAAAGWRDAAGRPIRNWRRYLVRAADGGEAVEAAFVRFWDAYPRKQAKRAAQDAFRRLLARRDDAEGFLAALLEAVAKQAKSEQWRREAGRYVPLAATWLNDGRWEDELPERGPNALATAYSGAQRVHHASNWIGGMPSDRDAFAKELEDHGN